MPAGRIAIRIPSGARSFRIGGGHGKTIPAVAHESCPGNVADETIRVSMSAQSPFSFGAAGGLAVLRRTAGAASLAAVLSLSACQSLLRSEGRRVGQER